MATFRKGDHIVNTVGSQQIFCIVVEVRKDGLLVVNNPRMGGRWIADPDKCRLFN